MVLVGYHPVHGFFIKNSWGDWGYGGFGWIERNDNMGICEYAVDITTQYDSSLNVPLHSCGICED